MLDKKSLLSLMITTAKASPKNQIAYSYGNKTFSYSELNEALRRELEPYCKTYRDYEANKNLIFSLMEETMDIILPQKTLERYADFAETKVFAQGDRPVFTRRTGLLRAKQFVTRVGLAGVYEVFKLGGESFEVTTSAIGGAAQVGFEEFMDGMVDFAELMNVIMEGMDEVIYREIAKALQAAVSQLPAANKVSAAGFDEGGMDRLVQVASAYGQPVIYCTREFAVKMIPSENWASNNMKEDIWYKGYLGTYKGCQVIVLPQGFEDETNSMKTIDPGYAWVIPTGGNDKPVKIAYEGTTHIRERENEDWSRDFQVYRKVGVAVMMTNNICSYVDTELKGKLSTISN